MYIYIYIYISHIMTDICFTMHGSPVMYYSSFEIIIMIDLRQWMDILHRADNDFTSVMGFILSVRDTMRIKKGGLLWAGHPCGPSLVYTYSNLNSQAEMQSPISKLQYPISSLRFELPTMRFIKCYMAMFTCTK